MTGLEYKFPRTDWVTPSPLNAEPVEYVVLLERVYLSGRPLNVLARVCRHNSPVVESWPSANLLPYKLRLTFNLSSDRFRFSIP